MRRFGFSATGFGGGAATVWIARMPNSSSIDDRTSSMLQRDVSALGEIVRSSESPSDRPVEHGLRQIVESDDGRRRHEIEVLRVSAIERVILTASQQHHGCTFQGANFT